MWTVARVTKHVIAIIAVGMSLYHLTVAFIGAPQQLFFRSTHLLFAMALVFLIYPSFRKKEPGGQLLRDDAGGTIGGTAGAARAPWIDWLLIAATAVTIVYVWWNHEHLITRFVFVEDPQPIELALGAIFTLLVLEATRRVIGWALPLTALIFLGYALFYANTRPQQLIEIMYLTTEGIFGTTLGVSAAYVILFVLFGAFMERTGVGKLFMDFALSLTGHTAGGPGKVAVVSSSLFGTVSGSAVANVLVDGPITIPLMKRSGFRPAFAAAVESTASTGGQIMPPIMGAAAFVMAEFLAVSYFQVTVWAIIPAILYYIAVFFAVHFEAKRVGLLGLPRSEIPRLGRVMRERGHLFLPILVVLGGLIAGYSAPLCALAGTISCIPVALLRKATRAGINWRTVWDALEEGAKNAIAVALACACAGIIIGVITQTGAAINLPPCGRTRRTCSRSRWFSCARQHRAWNGHADNAHHRHGVAAGAADQARRDPSGGAHVRVLLRDTFRDHAPRRARRLRGGRAGESQSVAVGLDRRAGGSRRLHRAVHVRLRALATYDRRLDGDPAFLRVGHHRHDLPRRGALRVPVPRGASLGAHLPHLRRSPADKARARHRSDRDRPDRDRRGQPARISPRRTGRDPARREVTLPAAYRAAATLWQNPFSGSRSPP
jgi:TRAP transporter 4TM/12TM fusion protein